MYKIAKLFLISILVILCGICLAEQEEFASLPDNSTPHDLILWEKRLKTKEFVDKINLEFFRTEELTAPPVLVINKNGVFYEKRQLCYWLKDNADKEHEVFKLDKCSPENPFVEFEGYKMIKREGEKKNKKGINVFFFKFKNETLYFKPESLEDYGISKSKQKLKKHYDEFNEKFLKKTNYAQWTKEVLSCLKGKSISCFEKYLADSFSFTITDNLCETDAAEWADSNEQSRSKFMKCLSTKKFQDFLIGIFSDLTYPEFEGGHLFNYATHKANKGKSSYPYEYGIYLGSQKTEKGKWVIKKLEPPGD